MKGETREATKGFDAAGEYAGVWAPSSSWRLPGVKMWISQLWFGFHIILTSHQRRERKPKVYAAYGGKR